MKKLSLGLMALTGALLSSCLVDSPKQGAVITTGNTVGVVKGQLQARQFQSDSGQLFLIDSNQTVQRQLTTTSDGHFAFDSVKSGNWQLLWTSPEEIAQSAIIVGHDSATAFNVQAQVKPILHVSFPSEIKQLYIGNQALSQDSLGNWKLPLLPNGTLIFNGKTSSNQVVQFQAIIKNYQVQITRLSDHSVVQNLSTLLFPQYSFAVNPYVQWHSRQISAPGYLKDLSGHNHPLQFLGLDSTFLGLGFGSGNQVYFAGDSILPWTIAEGSTYLQFWSFNRPKSDKAFPLIADEGRRMTVYWYNDSLYWYKNNDDLYQVLVAPFKWDSNALVDLHLRWGKDGMRLYSKGQLLAQNTLSTPYQHSTRNWANENDIYIGRYAFGTVAVEPCFQDLNPLQGYFIQAAILDESQSSANNIVNVVPDTATGDTIFKFNFNGSNAAVTDQFSAQVAQPISPAGWQLPSEILPDGLTAGEVGVIFTLKDSVGLGYQTLVGNSGQRMAIYVNKTSIVWYKNLSDLWQITTLNVDSLVVGRQYLLRASWGASGTTLNLDGVATTTNTSITTQFQNSPRTTAERILYTGYLPSTTVSLPISNFAATDIQFGSMWAVKH